MARPDYSNEDRRDFMKTIARQTLGVSFAGSVAAPVFNRDGDVVASISFISRYSYFDDETKCFSTQRDPVDDSTA